MEPYRIKILNAIAAEGLELLTDNYVVGEDEADPHGIVVRSSPVNIDDYPSLLAVARAGAGVNNIPVEKATKKGICVFNTPGANANAVVELVFTMLGIHFRNTCHAIAFCRKLIGLDNEDIEREVEAKKKMFRGEEMAGKVLGIIGLGQIGVRVANAGIHHGMRVVAFDPFPLLDNIHVLLPEVELVRSRDEVMARADIISLHVPLNKNTQGLISDELLSLVKPEAILINYSRGPIVDESALLKALNEDRLSGFMTDFPSAAILGHDKILVSPHLGASTRESEGNCACMAVSELKNYLEYGNVTHSVNFPNIESIPSAKVHTRLIVVNEDLPGMIGSITNILGANYINIASLNNESNGTIGYNIIDCESEISDAVLTDILDSPGVIRTRAIRLHQEER